MRRIRLKTTSGPRTRADAFVVGLNALFTRATWAHVAKRVRAHFLAGLLVVIPLMATLLILKWLFEWVDDILQPVIRGVFGRPLYGLGFLSTVVLVYITGVVTTHFGGRRLVVFGESLLTRVPIVRQMYNGIKQVVESFTAPRETGFMEVVMVEFPRKGMYMLGFITNATSDESGRRLVNVFVPTAPNPTSGFLQIVPEEDVIRTSVPVDDALKMVVSAGRVSVRRKDIQRLVKAAELARVNETADGRTVVDGPRPTA